MKILIACEYSGIVRNAFAQKGHDVTSCDFKESETEGKHYQGNVLDIINENWDMMIAFPPCTHLATSGARWFKEKTVKQMEALNFVKTLMNANIPKIAIENPKGLISSTIRKPTQIIQPWMFGDEYQKTTCLWLKNLMPLVAKTIATIEQNNFNLVETCSKGDFVIHGGKKIPKWYSNRSQPRDKSFPGIAQAMSEQWS